MDTTNEPMSDAVYTTPEPQSRAQNIRSVLSDGKSKKMIAAVILVAVVAIGAGIMLMTRQPVQKVPNDMSGVKITAPPNGTAASTPTPFYRQALEETETKMAAQAEQTGGSHVKTMLDRPEEVAKPAPTQQAPRQIQAPAPQYYNQQQNQQLYTRASQQIASLTDQWVPGAPQVVVYKQDEGKGASSAVTGAKAGVVGQQAKPTVLVRAGERYTATLDYGINTDIKTGKVIATLRSGPYAKQKLVGSVKREGETAVVAFDSMSLPDEASVKIEAYAVDVETTLPGLASEVDNHYFERYVLGGAMRLIEGIGLAASRGSTTIDVNVNGGFTSQQDALDSGEQAKMAAGFMAGQIAKDMAANQPKEPTVKVDIQTPLLVVFVKDVVKQNR